MGLSDRRITAWAASAGLHAVAVAPLLLGAAEAPLVVPVAVTEIAPLAVGPMEPNSAAEGIEPVVAESAPMDMAAAAEPETVASEAPPESVSAEAPQDVLAASPPETTQATAAVEPVAELPPEPEPPPERVPEPRNDLVLPPPQAPPPPQPVRSQPRRPRTAQATASTTAPPPAVAPAPARAVAARPSADYLGALLGALERHKRYPSDARRRRAQGTAMLRFRLRRDGVVTAWRIERSTGDPELDAAVAAMIQAASPLPAPPADLAGDGLELVLPVRFSLR